MKSFDRTFGDGCCDPFIPHIRKDFTYTSVMLSVNVYYTEEPLLKQKETVGLRAWYSDVPTVGYFRLVSVMSRSRSPEY